MTVLAALAGIAAQLCGVGLTASAAWLIARAAEQPPLSALGLAIVAVRAFASARGVFGYLERLAGHDAALGRITELRVLLFRALAQGPAPTGPVPTAPAAAGAGPPPARPRDGEALTHMVSDLDAAQDIRLRCALPAVVSAITALAATVFCAVLLPAAGAVLAGGALVAGAGIPAGAAFAARRLGGRVSAARSDLALRVLDLTDGHTDLVAFGALDTAVAAAERAARRLARLERASGTVSAAALAGGILVQGMTAIVVALVAAGAGPVLSAVLVLTTLVALEAVLPMSAAAQLYVELRPALARVRSLLGERSPDLPAEQLHYPSGPGRVALRGVSVRFGDTLALDEVNLDLAPGRSVAVLGQSGAGKSTLLAVLAGLVPPSKGMALLRPARGMFQEAHLFNTTVRANLLMARPQAGDSVLRRVLEQVRMDEWLDALPDGLDGYVGEGGRDMSGGQRQRLLLARALLADPEVLLLDEPTEALDAQTGRAVLEEVLRARHGRTTVVVTHREDALELFDDIVIMANGRVELHDFGGGHQLSGPVSPST